MRVRQIAAVLGVTALGFVALPARADEPGNSKTDKAKQEVKEKQQDLKEKLKESREELKDKNKELKKDLKDKKDELDKGVKEERKDLKEALAKLRETRAERRKQRREAIKQKYGDLTQKPEIRSELKTHAWRIARLNQIKRLADDQDKSKVEDRTDKLIEKENARHDKRMDELKAKAAQPTTTVKGGAQ